MHCDNYQEFEEGNQIPYPDFEKYLDKEYGSKFHDLDKNHLIQRMRDLMIDAFLSGFERLEGKRKIGSRFEVVGFDFLIDEDLRVWLIEVNTCPFQGPVLTAHHESFMLDMLDDVLKITVDKIFMDSSMSLEDMSE
jgi:hypothetical protein